ncbi:MAG: M1 family metallopeptidase [Candidatus Saccharibacteria bacterium]|nr:M1 family metallopeptidase [Candidatus Saccharibacteria bacterium]
MKLEHFFTYFEPENYRLTLDINRQARTFNGKLILTGRTKKPDQLIKLHANYLNITQVLIDQQAVDFEYQDNVLTLHGHNNQPITIIYSGIITNQMNGIYPCYYRLNGEPQELIATQFESHYAREVFPCVDEPEAKASFDLTLITEPNKTVLANTDIISQDIENQQMTTVFASTPKMSCYTLAFVIGDFNKKTAFTKSGVQINVFATPAHSSEALDFALDTAVKSIDFYEHFLGVNYPLKKCDQVALPDFAAGAMENWGLITYRESMMLADQNTAIDARKQIATTIAHELAHMWFGNLVTMKWWDELWLNESLATLLEHFAIDAIYPEYQIWDDFYSLNYQYAQARDALPGVQAILTPINHPDEISTIFDGAIVYAKGACIMKMLQNFLGLKTFQKALSSFLQEFAYQNPTTADFLHHFDRASGQNISRFMDNWLHQSGFPLLEITDHKISQQQFGYQTDQMWSIPIAAKNLPDIFDQHALTITNNFTVINKDITSFVITNYNNSNKAKVRHFLASDEASTLDQFYFLSNQILLAKHNYIKSDELISDLQSFIGQETTLLVWNNLSRIITYLRFFVDRAPSENKLKQLVISLAKPQLIKLGYHARTSDSFNQIELRSLLIDLLSYAEDSDTHEFLLQTFTNFQSDLLTINPDLRATVLITKIKYDFSESVFEQLLNLYQTTHNPDFKHDLQLALTSAKNLNAGQKLINKLNDNSLIKNQDLASWFLMILRNRQLKNLAWQWLKDNFTNLRQIFSENKDYADFARYAGSILYTDQELAEFKELFSPYYDDLAMTRTIKVGISEIKLRNKLFKSDADGVIKKLSLL